MALIKCPDCGADVSDSAFSCLTCGKTISAREQVAVGRTKWEAGTIIAALIGLLALIVSGYTAWVQREQVRAQVWPHLLVGFADPEGELVAINKGVGPAIVRGVEVTVDGRPQPNWRDVFDALGMATDNFQMSTLDKNVLSPNERLDFMSLKSPTDYKRFCNAFTSGRVAIDICFCSTLGDCWVQAKQKKHGSFDVQRVSVCPRLSSKARFLD